MADYYVRSGASGSATGADWTNAFTTLTAALSGRAATDRIFVANDHNESTAGTVTLTCPATPGLQILGVNTNSTEPPTGLVSTPTANVAVGSTGSALTLQGCAYIYGINFLGSTTTSSASVINVLNTAATGALYFDKCSFQTRNANAGASIFTGPAASSSQVNAYVSFKNCTFLFNATTQGIRCRHGRVDIVNMAIDSAGAAPTTLFSAGNTNGNDTDSVVVIESSDLSAETFTNLVSYTSGSTIVFIFRNCKLPSGINVVTGTNPNPGGNIVKLHNCDSTDTNYRFAEHYWQGSIVQQTSTRTRTGGAEDAGGTPYSWLMTGTANAEAQWDAPLVSPELSYYNETVDSAITVTVEILRDNATNLQNDEVWLEVDYLGTSGFPQGTRVTDRMTDVFSTPADQDSSSVSWDTTGMTNANKQKLSVTFTPREKGYIHARVALAKDTSIYVDPLITVT